uniref:Uncharacterized protein n=1 Tax=Chlamydomonas euryale TaxID=1486919 RepID=A0A7R9V475_9CHLO
MDVLDLPNELKGVPRPVLEDYVFRRIRQFSLAFAEKIRSPAATGAPVEVVFNQTASLLSAYRQTDGEILSLKFAHRCKFSGCRNKECGLCANNPSKRCEDGDNFDESYADQQLLKSKCDSDIHVEAVDIHSGQAVNLSGMEVVVAIVDGMSCSINPDETISLENLKVLHASDEGRVLLGSALPAPVVANAGGQVVLTLTNGLCKLPDLHVTGKTDTFRLDGQSVPCFRLLARAVNRDALGRLSVREDIRPALSARFTVKSQRAMNDYNKPEFPHYKDKVTKLKFIGSVTAERLKDIRSHMPDAPFSTIDTVEQLKHLMLFVDQHRNLEAKLLDVLHMMGRHKHKWEYLREVLADKVVYDDTLNRIWMGSNNIGLLYTCKQGQVSLEKPSGLVQQLVCPQTCSAVVQLLPPHAAEGRSAELMRTLRGGAEESWYMDGHPGWQVLPESADLGSGSLPGTNMQLGGTVAAAMQQQGVSGMHAIERSSSNVSSVMQSVPAAGAAATLGRQPELAGSAPPTIKMEMGMGMGAAPRSDDSARFSPSRALALGTVDAFMPGTARGTANGESSDERQNGRGGDGSGGAGALPDSQQFGYANAAWRAIPLQSTSSGNEREHTPCSDVSSTALRAQQMCGVDADSMLPGYQPHQPSAGYLAAAANARLAVSVEFSNGSPMRNGLQAQPSLGRVPRTSRSGGRRRSVDVPQMQQLQNYAPGGVLRGSGGSAAAQLMAEMTLSGPGSQMSNGVAQAPGSARDAAAVAEQVNASKRRRASLPMCGELEAYAGISYAQGFGGEDPHAGYTGSPGQAQSAGSHAPFGDPALHHLHADACGRSRFLAQPLGSAALPSPAAHMHQLGGLPMPLLAEITAGSIPGDDGCGGLAGDTRIAPQRSDSFGSFLDQMFTSAGGPTTTGT